MLCSQKMDMATSTSKCLYTQQQHHKLMSINPQNNANEITSKGRAYLAVAVVDTEDLGPLRPRVRGGPRVRGLGQQLEVHHRTAAVPHGGTDAVRTGVTALKSYFVRSEERLGVK